MATGVKVHSISCGPENHWYEKKQRMKATINHKLDTINSDTRRWSLQNGDGKDKTRCYSMNELKTG